MFVQLLSNSDWIFIHRSKDARMEPSLSARLTDANSEAELQGQLNGPGTADLVQR